MKDSIDKASCIKIDCPECGDALISVDTEHYIGKRELVEKHEGRTSHTVVSFYNYTVSGGEFEQAD